EAELYVALAESEPAAEGVEVEGGHADPGEAERHGVTDHGRGMVEQRGEAQPLRALDAFLPADEQLHRRADERRLAREVPERGRVQAGRGALPRDLEAHFALLDQERRIGGAAGELDRGPLGTRALGTGSVARSRRSSRPS